jgi:hypothetical protein
LIPAIAAGVIAGAFAVTSSSERVIGSVPDRLDDSTFWQAFTDLSEEGGTFRSDNFVSNEAAFQYVIPDLQQRIEPGGVYLGVGPDQNFTYVVAFKPSISFIVDIRRQNAMQHLMYKALIELSADRADFLSRLFSRARPRGLDSTSTAATLLSAYAAVFPDTLSFRRNFNDVSAHLRETRRFPLTVEDLQSIEYVYRAFYQAGPNLTYSFGLGNGGFSYWAPQGAPSPGGDPNRFGRGLRGMPTYAWLMTEDDGQGVERSYLATERNFLALKDAQTRNLIVPVVGDFAGGKAVRAVGRWVRRRGATVSVFYTSNVEQYLFQQGDDWNRFYGNVQTLPIDNASTFIRSVSTRTAGKMQNPNSRSAQLVLPIAELLAAYNEGKVKSYYDVVSMSR